MRSKHQRTARLAAALLLTAAAARSLAEARPVLQTYAVPAGSHPHDVAPAPDGRVWYTAQYAGALGWIDPATGAGGQIPLGAGSRPHGVIVGPDGNPWVTDGGLNAVVRVEAATGKVTPFPLPAGSPDADLNTAAFDSRGVLWFTGQSGYYGSVEPDSGRVRLFEAPRGRGPYGIASCPDGFLYYVSLAAGYLGRIDPASGRVQVLEPPGKSQGTRRVWADSRSVLWVAGWYSGRLLRYDPPSGRFDSFQLSSGDVRQLLGRPGELWGAESGADRLVVIRY